LAVRPGLRLAGAIGLHRTSVRRPDHPWSRHSGSSGARRRLDRPLLAGSSCPSPRHIPVIGGDRLGTVAGAAAVVAILAATVLSC